MKSRILSSARLSIPLATSIAALLAVSSAQAGTVWDGGGGNTNINTAANWDSDVVNALNGTTAAVFGTGGSTATINVNASFTGITINRNANFTIANGAGSLTLGTGGITVTLPNTTARSHTISESSLILNGNQTWTVTNNTGAATLSVSSVISETGGARNLTKAGSGTLTLSGLNTYTGVTTITAGTLSINRFTDGGVAGSLGMASNDSANLVMTGGTLSYSGASTTTDRGITFGALSGNPIITVSATGANLNLTNVIAGTASQQIDFTKGGVGTLTLSNDNNSYIGRTFVSGGTLAVTSISAVGAGTSSIGVATTAANGLISIGTGANTTTLSYIGTGNTTDRDLNLPGTAGGGVIEQSGTGLLKFTGAVGATGVGSKTLTLRGSTTGTGEIAGAIVDNGTTGTTVATAASNNSTSLVLGSVVGLTVGNEITGAGIPSSTTITAINPATRTVTLSAAATVASNAVITSSGLVNLTSLTKDGTGTWALTGANTYTGTTTVSAGTLDLGGATATGSLSSPTLTLAGGTFSYTRTGNTTQGFTTTNINAATASPVSVAAGNTLNLGTVTRGVGGWADFSTTGAGTVAALESNNVGGIMPGFTFGNTWAVANGDGVAISGLGSYTLTSAAGTDAGNYTDNNIDVDNSAGTLDGAITTNSLRFSTAAANTVTLTGTPNVITSGGIFVTSDVGANLSTITGGELAGAAGKDLAVIQNNALGGLAISSVLTDNGEATGLTKSGPGLLTLSGANTYTGVTAIQAGTLQLSGAGRPGAVGSPVSVSSGAVLDLNGTDQTITLVAGSGVGTVANNSGSGTSILTLAGTGTINGALVTIVDHTTTPGGKVGVVITTNTQPMSNLNTYSGGTTVNAGAFLYLNSASPLGAGTGPISLPASGASTSLSSGFLVDGGATYAYDISGAGYIHNNTNGTGTAVLTGTLNTSGTFNFRNASAAFHFAGSGNSTLSGIIGPVGGSGVFGPNDTVAGGSIIKSGAGTLTLTGANNYTGATTINGGNLILSGSGVIRNTATNAITINDTGTLTMSRTDTWGNSASGNPLLPIVINAGGTMTTGGNFFNTLGALTLNGGTLTGTGGANAEFGSWALRGTVTVGGSAASTISQSGANANINLGAGSVTGTTFNVTDVTGNADMDLIVSATLQDGKNASNLAQSSSLTKTGAGTMALSGANTYTGATLVSAGTLFVTGSLTSDVTVGDTATLGGGGTVQAVSFGGGSFFDIFLAVGSLDPLASTATISFSGTGFGIDNLVSQGSAINWSSIADGTYTLITGTLAPTNLGNFGLANAYDIGSGRSAYFESGSLQLVVIPEPSAALLGGLGLLALLRRRRRH